MPDSLRPGAPEDDPVRRTAARIDGWKGIAAHLQRGVRTVQRWEKELGLPVRRLGGGRGEVVFALTEELDRWLLSWEGLRARGEDGGEPDESAESGAPEPRGEPLAGREEAATGGAGTGVADGERADAVPGPPSTAEAAGHGDRQSRAARRWRRASIVAVLVLAAAAIAGAGWVAHGLMYPESSPAGQPAGSPASLGDANPVDVRVEHDVIVVFNALEQEVWRHRFEEHCDPAAYKEVSTYRSLSRVEDIDGDGANEVLFVAGIGGMDSDAINALYVFDSDGTVRFRYAPAHRVRFGMAGHPRGGPYVAEPSWLILDIHLDGRPGGRRRIWLTCANQFYPSGLDRIEPDGRVTATYWSNGAISEVDFARLGGRDVVLVGASNNEHRGGSLAVLDAAAPSATAPAADPGYQCRAGCSDAVPLRFLVWPQPPLLAGLDATDPIRHITVSDSGRLTLVIGSPGGVHPPDGTVHFPCRHYVLGPNLEVLGAEVDRTYRLAYAALLRAGMLHRPYDPRPEVHLFPILDWDGHGFRPIAGSRR